MPSRITTDNCQILITAEEAFHALERAVLKARAHVNAGFRIFDLSTQLHTPEACKIGETWFDLLEHKLNQGVRVSLALSDFDPVVGGDTHALTWRAIRYACALNEVTRRPELLHIRPSLHAARTGWLSNIGLWIRSRGMIAAQAAAHNKLDGARRERFCRERPGLMRYLAFDESGTARARVWPPAVLYPATHHQKLAVIDSRLVYIGGLDLNDRRYDTKRHAQKGPQTWHDVQVLVEDGELAKTAEAHLAGFEDVIAGKAQPAPRAAPFLRTISTIRRNPMMTLSPLPMVRELRQAHLDGIARARDMIYLETQFFRDSDLTDALCAAARHAPDLNVVLILPAAPEEVAFDQATSMDSRYGEYLQAKCLNRLTAAFGSRLFIGAPVTQRRKDSNERDTLHRAPVLYVHAKVSIFDDRAAIASSANLNGRSMNWDTEAGLEMTDPGLVRHFKTRCIRHWLPDETVAPYLEGRAAAQAWRDRAERAADRPPDARRSFIVPYALGPARRFGRNLPGVPEELV